MSWKTPTTYLQRMGDAIALLCGGHRPSDEILGAWLNECEDDYRLQEFACEHGPSWAQGIAVIDAAHVLADQPTEILCIDGHDVLMVRTSHVMDHIAHTNSLRDKWNALPVKSDRIFKRQLVDAGVLSKDYDDKPVEFERTIRGRREAHLVGIDMHQLELYGLYAGPSVERDQYGH